MLVPDVSIFAAFVAGILLFFTPCVLPLIPVYLAYISGVSVSHVSAARRLIILGHAILFVLGFSVVFVILGASIGFVGFLVTDKVEFLRYISGALLIVFGVLMLGFIKLPFLMRDFHITHPMGKNVNLIRSFLIGAAFAFGWSPCIGPVLGGILTLAYSSDTALNGAALLSIFSLGLAIPFLLSAFFVDFATRFFKRIRVYVRILEFGAGIFLIALGILILTDTLTTLNGLLPYSNLTWS